MKMKKNKMYTGQNGVSYYKVGNRYYSNSGWLEREITKLEYEENVNRINDEIASTNNPEGNPLERKKMETKKKTSKKSELENIDDEKKLLDLFLYLSGGLAYMLIVMLYLTSENSVNGLNK